MPSPRALLSRLALGFSLAGASACSLFMPLRDVSLEAVEYGVAPADALEVASDVLGSQGWKMGRVDADLLFLEGEQDLQFTRSAAGVPGQSGGVTRVKQQVVVQATARPEGGSSVRATFNIFAIPPSGIRRNFDASSPEALELRERFFEALSRELGGSLPPAPVSSP